MRLLLTAGLDCRQVALLRAYCKYLLQAGVSFSQAYMEQTLARYPLDARLLAELFESRFDPAHDRPDAGKVRSEEPRSELQSLMRSTSAVYCFKKKTKIRSTHSVLLDQNQHIHTPQISEL